MTESFEDAIKALRHIARGNGAVMRIADRIVAAHERETKVEGVCGPITGELRAAMHQWGWVESDGSITFATSPTPPSIDAEQSLAISGSDFERLCDAIDAVHAQLERENAALKAELDRVLGEQEDERHTIGESITEELRGLAVDPLLGYASQKVHAEAIIAIADRIDAKHKRAVMSAMNDALYHANDESMAELRWMRLPVDANRVPIFIGDVMESDYITRTEVVAVGIKCFFAWSNIDRRWHQYEANQFRHHQPDTWERIIEDAFDAAIQGADERWDSDVDRDILVSRCKALAGDAE